MARIQKAIKSAVLGVVAALAMIGCKAMPMYDFEDERGLVRFENKGELTDKVQAYGRLELREKPDGDIENFVARGYLEYALGHGWYFVGNYIALPGDDIPLIGVGQSGKIGENVAYRVQVKVRTEDTSAGDKGSLELEGLLCYNREKGGAFLLVRGYPDDGTMTLEASVHGRLGEYIPMIEVSLSGKTDNLDAKLFVAFGRKF